MVRHIADDRFDAYTDQWHAAVDEIAVMPASTPEGLRAKATVLRAALLLYAVDDPDDAHCGVDMAWSPVNDVLGRAGG